MARQTVVIQGSPKSAHTVQARFAVPNLSSPGISGNLTARRDASTHKVRCSSVTPAQRSDAVARHSGAFTARHSEAGSGSLACSLAASTMAPEAGSRVVTDRRPAVARSASARPLFREVTNSTTVSTQLDSRVPAMPSTSTSRLTASSRAMFSASTRASPATRVQEVTNSSQCSGRTQQFQSQSSSAVSPQKVHVERFAALESLPLESRWIAQLTLRKEKECPSTPQSPLSKPSRAMTPLPFFSQRDERSSCSSMSQPQEAAEKPSKSELDSLTLPLGAAPQASQPSTPQQLCRRGSAAEAKPCYCNLETVVAAGDVLFFKGNRSGLSSAGTAGGLLGHVMLVLAPPTRICAHSEEAEWLEDAWPKDGASEIWRVRTAESARKRKGLYEANVLLHVEADSGRLTFIGEVLGESVLTSGEEVEVWQSPVDLRMRLDAKLVDEVLAEMRDQATSWSWATAARAFFASAAGGGKGSGIGYLHAVGGATISGCLEGATGTASGESKAQFLREITNTWASDPICTSVVISFWQRVLCKLAGGVGIAGGEGNSLAPSSLAHEPADLILHWMPLWADRSLPHKLRETMQTCGWRNGISKYCDRAPL
jgi:hypothetical protein